MQPRVKLVHFMPQLESEHPDACDNEILHLVFSVTYTCTASAGAAAVRKVWDVCKKTLSVLGGGEGENSLPTIVMSEPF